MTASSAKIWSSRAENLPLSFSRWSDISGDADKWAFFERALAAGSVVAFDPRDAIPKRWSLRPEDVSELILWTKSPSRLLLGLTSVSPLVDLLPVLKVHVTITGWREVEPRVPALEVVALETKRLALMGIDVTWRFSPVPLLESEQVRGRFASIAARLGGWVPVVFVSFLAENEFVPETRGASECGALVDDLARIAAGEGIELRLCADDAATTCSAPRGVCAPARSGAKTSPCGCGLAVDPFSFNESCDLGCRYCFVLNREMSPRKRNTTKLRLPITR